MIKKRIVPLLIDLDKFEYLIPHILGVLVDCLKKDDLYSVQDFATTIEPFIVALTKST